jgi:hypothetical protein
MTTLDDNLSEDVPDFDAAQEEDEKLLAVIQGEQLFAPTPLHPYTLCFLRINL